MTDWELILNMVGEKATKDITVARNAQGFDECEVSAKKGGQIAHNVRLEIEQETGKPVVSKENFLNLAEPKKKKLSGKNKT